MPKSKNRRNQKARNKKRLEKKNISDASKIKSRLESTMLNIFMEIYR